MNLFVAERAGMAGDEDRRDSLPSYTLVTGLPTYEQAIAIESDKAQAADKSLRQSSEQSTQHYQKKS